MRQNEDIFNRRGGELIKLLLTLNNSKMFQCPSPILPQPRVIWSVSTDIIKGKQKFT